MELISKLVVLIFMLASLIFAQSHELIQAVYIWPDGYDADGVKWYTYDLYLAETHWNNESSVTCYTEDYTAAFDCIVWHSEIGNFPGGWQKRDTIVAFGSWDSVAARDSVGYPNNPNHTGFYWLYSDTMDATVDPQYWTPNDTLRVLPKPIVSKTGPGGGANDTIWVEIPNPNETRRADQTEYDVLGYWLWADSTGTGTPNAFNAGTAMEIGFIPVQGDTSDTTVYWQLESEGFLPWDHWTTYFAYKLVARPDTTGSDDPGSPGYSTYYFSQNSDAIDVYQIVIGIEEDTHLNHSSTQLEISPNPFTDRTDITCSMGQSAKGTELRIYDVSGKLVKDFLLPTAYSILPTVVPWYGTDESGELLPSGVYFIQAKSSDLNLTKKVILQR